VLIFGNISLACAKEYLIAATRAVMVSKTETVVFSQTDGNHNPGFFVPDERLFKSGQPARFTVAA